MEIYFLYNMDYMRVTKYVRMPCYNEDKIFDIYCFL